LGLAKSKRVKPLKNSFLDFARSDKIQCFGKPVPRRIAQALYFLARRGPWHRFGNAAKFAAAQTKSNLLGSRRRFLSQKLDQIYLL